MGAPLSASAVSYEPRATDRIQRISLARASHCLHPFGRYETIQTGTASAVPRPHGSGRPRLLTLVQHISLPLGYMRAHPLSVHAAGR
jgi:hypothetical protein